MSPEIIESEKYNSKTDVWSLGCILYEIIHLKVPFAGKIYSKSRLLVAPSRCREVLSEQEVS
jgi:NIMA (never in mitosis gene a)-related kinase